MRGSVGKPCDRGWDDLEGDGRTRYCSDCRKSVHDVASFTDEEWERLAATGPICGRTPGETYGPAPTRRAVFAGVLLASISPLLANDGRLNVVVVNPQGALVKGAQVSLTLDRKRSHSGVTGALGFAEFTGLPRGLYEVSVRVAGFRDWIGKHLVDGKPGELRIPLQAGFITVGEMAPRVETH